MVKLIQKNRPRAIEDLDSEKLQIKIDQIDRKTLKSIELLIENLNSQVEGKVEEKNRI